MNDPSMETGLESPLADDMEQVAGGPLEPHERLRSTLEDWETHFTDQQGALRVFLKRARATPALREKRSQLTATALNGVLETARVTRAKSLMSNFLSGSQDLTPYQLRILLRELARHGVIQVEQAVDTSSDLSERLDPNYAAALTRLSSALSDFLIHPDQAEDDLARWEGDFFLVRRSFFAPTYYCLAHVLFKYEALSHTMSVVETNRHDGTPAPGREGMPAAEDLMEHYDGVLVIERQDVALMLSFERTSVGASRGSARVAMLDRPVLDQKGKVAWAKGRMLISGQKSEPIVLYRVKQQEADKATLQTQSCLLKRDQVDPIVLAQLDAEIQWSGRPSA